MTVTLPSSSNPSPLVGAIVSGRGGKTMGPPREHHHPSYAQATTTTTTTTTPIPPIPSSIIPRGVTTKGGTFSGAAAAAMLDNEFMPAPPSRDVAFGRQFHVPDGANDGSMISGLSGPTTVMSGVSGISALTDPSLLGGTPTSMRGAHHGQPVFPSLRMSQLNQLRQQWAAQHYGNSLQTEGLSSRMLLSSQTGLGSSMQGGSSVFHPQPPPSQQQYPGSSNNNHHHPQQQHHSRSHSLQDLGSIVDGMSWAENSLVGGGLGASTLLNDSASIGNYSAAMQHSVAPSFTMSVLSKDDSWLGHASSVRYHHPAPSQQQPLQYPHTIAAAATDIATNSNSNSASDPSEDRSKSTASSRSTAQQRNYGGGGMGGGALSIHSGGGESISMHSIMSDLSENLIALDLAGTHGSLLDQL